RTGWNDGSCFLYAASDHVVLPQRLTKPRPKPETIRETLDYLKVPGYSYNYLNDKGHKAIAVAPERGQTFRWTGLPSAAEAEQRALEGCQLSYRMRCVLLARDEELRAPDVWRWNSSAQPHVHQAVMIFKCAKRISTRGVASTSENESRSSVLITF